MADTYWDIIRDNDRIVYIRSGISKAVTNLTNKLHQSPIRMKFVCIILISTYIFSVWGSPLSKECVDTNKTCLLHETCCNFKEEGNTGCCPLNNAVCCKDQTHCCPQGYHCSDEDLLCQREAEPSIRKVPIPRSFPLRKIEKSNDKISLVYCEDGTSICGDDTTCCQLESGMWGCCPMVNARCCSDGKHCCPRAYDCNTTTAECYKPSNSQFNLPLWVKAGVKQKAMNIAEVMANRLRSTTCDDNSTCPESYSCCQLDAQGDFGCCEGSNSVCCGDLKHWCPEGYSCDLGRGECRQVSIHDDQNIAI